MNKLGLSGLLPGSGWERVKTMKRNLRRSTLFILLVMLSGCSTNPPAPDHKASSVASNPSFVNQRDSISVEGANSNSSPNGSAREDSRQRVSFTDLSHGWLVVGHDIFRTEDRGLHWSKIANINANVFDIDFVSLKLGWLATGGGLLKTQDGGLTWDKIGMSQVKAVNQVQFVDAEHGWVLIGDAASSTTLMGTTDGGKSWTSYSVPGLAFGSTAAFSFISQQQGFVIVGSQPGAGRQGKTLFKTIDAGRRWQKVSSQAIDSPDRVNGLPGSGYVSAISFVNSQVGLFSEARGFVSVTMDGGVSWKPLGDYSDSPLEDLHLLDSKHGYAIYRNTLLLTQDGGATWKQIHPGLWPALFSLTHFFNSRDGVSAGSLVNQRAILSTTDGGFNWSQTGSVPGDGSIIDLSFPDREHGWVITESFLDTDIKRTIYRTVDGGVTWKEVISSTEQKNLYSDLFFVDENTGFVASGWGHLFVTHDGGKTFQVVDDKDSSAASLQFVSPSSGWKLMDHSLYATTDAGRTWKIVPLNGYMAADFDLVSRDKVWVIANGVSESSSNVKGSLTADGYHPKLLSTSDGGLAWIIHDLGNINPTDVVFADSEQGWLVDDHGNYYHTADGGHTWALADLLTR